MTEDIEYELVESNLDDFTGTPHLYKLSRPLVIESFSGKETEFEYVVVSATSFMGDDEVYAFPADEQGEIRSWGELPGSRKGRHDHEDILKNVIAAALRDEGTRSDSIYPA